MRGEGDSPQLGSSFLRSSDVIKKNGFDVSCSTREIPRNTERQSERERQGYGTDSSLVFMGRRREEQQTPCPPPVPVILPSKHRLQSVLSATGLILCGHHNESAMQVFD